MVFPILNSIHTCSNKWELKFGLEKPRGTEMNRKLIFGHFQLQLQPKLRTRKANSLTPQSTRRVRELVSWKSLTKHHTRYQIRRKDTSRSDIEQVGQREQLGKEGRMGTVEEKGKTARKDHCFGKIKNSS